MIYESQLQELLSKWKNTTTTVESCINDVERLIDMQYQEEAATLALMPSEEVQKYLDGLEADDYLAGAHEI
jgi:hypothetical protein